MFIFYVFLLHAVENVRCSVCVTFGFSLVSIVNVRRWIWGMINSGKRQKSTRKTLGSTREVTTRPVLIVISTINNTRTKFGLNGADLCVLRAGFLADHTHYGFTPVIYFYFIPRIYHKRFHVNSTTIVTVDYCFHAQTPRIVTRSP